MTMKQSALKKTPGKRRAFDLDFMRFIEGRTDAFINNQSVQKSDAQQIKDNLLKQRLELENLALDSDEINEKIGTILSEYFSIKAIATIRKRYSSHLYSMEKFTVQIPVSSSTKMKLEAEKHRHGYDSFDQLFDYLLNP